MGILEMLDSSTDGSFELDHGLAVVSDFGVDNDVQLHGLGLQETFHGLAKTET